MLSMLFALYTAFALLARVHGKSSMPNAKVSVLVSSDGRVIDNAKMLK
jgi:hypothetical protein